MSSFFQIVHAVAVIIGPFALAYFMDWVRRGRHAITWAAVSPKSMTDFAEELRGRLDVTLDGKPVASLTKYMFVLHNSGRHPIDGKLITNPLTWVAPGKILSAKVVNTNPPVELDVRVSGECAIFRWQLFNQRCQALVEILCDADENMNDGHVSAQIKGIPEVKSRAIQFVDEEAILRMNKIRRSQLPKAMRFLLSSRADAFLSRHLVKVLLSLFWFYGLFVVFIVYSFMTDFSPMIFEARTFVVFLTWFSTLVAALWYFRNPYAKLLKMRIPGRQQEDLN